LDFVVFFAALQDELRQRVLRWSLLEHRWLPSLPYPPTSPNRRA
jgi:hypothetical protein